MNRIQRRLRVVLAVLPLALGLGASPAPARADDLAEAFIQENIDKVYAILESDTLDREKRSREFREFILSLTDIGRIGRFTLGPYVNRATPAEVDAFVSAFADYAVAVYELRLSQYSGQTVMVSGSTDRSADDSVVDADIVNPSIPSAAPFKTAFRVRRDLNGNPIITDMHVEGVWLAINQRADFTSYLQQNGGSVPALSAYLERQASEIRASGNSGPT